MKILVVAALFPPDVAEPAPYIKELVSRLSKNHQVEVLTYGKIPESVAGVTITAVSKSTGTAKRLFEFAKTLQEKSKEFDIVLVNNAPSTELPTIFASLTSKARWFLLISDTKITYRGWRKLLFSLTTRYCTTINTDLPKKRPEVLPFKKINEQVQHEYDASWQTHITELEQSIV